MLGRRISVILTILEKVVILMTFDWQQENTVNTYTITVTDTDMLNVKDTSKLHQLEIDANNKSKVSDKLLFLLELARAIERSKVNG